MLYQEIEYHLLNDEKPSLYIQEIFSKGLLSEYPFNMIWELSTIPQSPKYHPEGDVFKHVMLVVDEAAKRRHLSKDPRTLMWGAFLHDIGKAPTTKLRHGRITSYDHDSVGANMAIKFLNEISEDEDFIKKVVAFVRWHMQSIYVLKNLPYQNVEQMLKEIELEEIELLTISDRLGRGGMDEEKVREEEENVKIFVRKCEKEKVRLGL